MQELEPKLTVIPLLEHGAKCGISGCNNVARAIVRYPDSSVSVFRRVRMCAPHTLKTMANEMDNGRRVEEQGALFLSHLKQRNGVQ
jgi:hypothetical protein